MSGSVRLDFDGPIHRLGAVLDRVEDVAERDTVSVFSLTCVRSGTLNLDGPTLMCTQTHTRTRMASKNIGIKEDVYERLKAHKRGGESFSETLDRTTSTCAFI